MKILYTNILFLFFSFSLAIAQNTREVKGSVKDEAGEPLPGVLVKVKDAEQAVQTDFDGNFKMTVKNGDVLSLSYMGMTTVVQKVVEGKDVYNVVLRLSAEALDDIVVTGFGSQKKANVTGATAKVSVVKTLGNRPVTNAFDAIQGVLPGLQVTTNSGQPGARGIGVNIRGFTSINGGSPLVLMDNVPVDMEDINPQDIETITVLKDASAAAIYGARAAFGVILITSKSNKKISKQKTRFNYSSTYSISRPEDLPDKATTYEFVKALKDWGTTGFWTGQDVGKWFDFLEEYKSNPSKYPKGYAEDGGLRYPLADTDVIGAWMKTGLTQIHNFNFSGSTDKLSYRVSMGFNDEDGIIVTRNDSYRKYNVNAALNAQLTKNLTSFTNIIYRNSNQRRPVGSFGNAVGYGPYVAAEGDHTFDDGTKLPYDSPANMERLKIADKRLRNNIRLFQRLKLDILKGLDITGEFTYVKGNVDETRVDNQPDVVRATRLTKQAGVADNTYYRKYVGNSVHRALNVYAKYNTTIQDHNVSFLLGGNAEDFASDGTTTKRNTLISAGLPSLSGATGAQETDDSFGEWAVMGVFGRLNYNFKEKYFLEFTGRYDGSSRFAKGKRFGFFPSFSAGWHLGKESFMESLTFLSNLKLRGSWGTVGNQNVRSYYPTIPGMSITSSSGAGWDRNSWMKDGASNRYSTLNMPDLVSENFTWETVQTLNIGLDAAFLNNRLNTNFDYFIRKTLDMLAAGSRLPSVLGASAPLQNVADLESKGWEFKISWQDKIGDFSYQIGFNIFDSQAEITRFHNPSGLLSQYYVGRKIGEIWGYTTDGYYTEDDFEPGTLNDNLTGGTLKSGVPKFRGVANPNPGDVKYVDKDGDGEINPGNSTLKDAGDRTVIGNSTRRYQYGINGNFSYKNFDLSFQMNGVGKRDIWLGNHLRFPYQSQFSIVYKSQLDYWTPDNKTAYFPRNYALGGGNYRISRQVQTKYLINGAYLRIRNIALGYTMPERVVKYLHIDRLRVFCSGENLYAFHNYPDGINPELTDRGSGLGYPFLRSFNIGLNLTF